MAIKESFSIIQRVGNAEISVETDTNSDEEPIVTMSLYDYDSRDGLSMQFSYDEWNEFAQAIFDFNRAL